MTRDERKMLRELADASTPVSGWYAHPQGDSVEEATVRGPFCRWFKVQEVQPQYRKYVATANDDARFAAAAMTNCIALLDEIDRLEAKLALTEKDNETSKG